MTAIRAGGAAYDLGLAEFGKPELNFSSVGGMGRR